MSVPLRRLTCSAPLLLCALFCVMNVHVVSASFTARTQHMRAAVDDTARCNQLLSRAITQMFLDPKQADLAIRRAFDLAEGSGYARGQAVVALLRGMRTARDGHHEEALSQLRAALVREQSRHADSVTAAIHFRIGHNAFILGNLDSAVLHLRTADRLWAKSGQLYGRTQALYDLGKIAHPNGEYSVIDSVLGQLDAHRAYEMHVLYAKVRDSIRNEDDRTMVRALSARYEAEQREKEIALQRRDLALRDLDLARQQEELLRRRIDARRRAQSIALLEKQGAIDRLTQEHMEAELARQRSEAERQREQADLLLARNRLQGVMLDEAAVNRNILFGGLAILAVIIVLLFRRYRERKRSGEEIERTLEKLRRTQDQLIHAEKMGTLGEMTAGIAHEIRNPMNFVSNFSHVARELSAEAREAMKHGDGELSGVLEQLEEAADKITSHSRRAENIVAGMLMHARSQAGVREARDLNPVIEEYVQLVWQGYRAQHPGTAVELEFVPDHSLGAIEMIPQEIARVIMNVLQNALQAVEQKQRTAGEDYAPRVHVSTYGIPTGAEIRIFDNGPGIPPDLRNKIFQPFFTTKTTGEGSGLGLSMAYDIVVKGHGGSIDFTSRPGQDTTFIIRLPREGGA